MIDAPIALALTLGMVAAVNPCGFAMLPAYLSFFLGLEGDHVPARGETVARVIPVALAVSAGFLAVFTMVGVVLRPIASTVQEYAPWASIAIGIGLVVLGVAMARGFTLAARLPKFGRGGRTAGLWSMFLYGVSYAIASLSCTIGIFLSIIVNAFTRTDFVSGVVLLATYALGMSLVMTTLTVALALARDQVVGLMRTAMRHADRAAGVLMVVVGAYVSWYGVFSLRARQDPTAAAGPVDWVEDWSSSASQFVQDVGATRLALLMGLAILAMVGASSMLSTRRSGRRPFGGARR